MPGHLTTSCPLHDRDWLFLARQGLRWGPQLACLGHLGPFSSRSLAFRRVSQTSSRVYGGGGGPQSRASRSLGLEVTQCQFCPTLLVKASRKPVSAVRRKQRREQLLPLGGILGTYRASFTGALVTAGPLKHAEVWCAAAGHARVHGGPQVSAPSRLSEAPPVGKWQALDRARLSAHGTSGPAAPSALH